MTSNRDDALRRLATEEAALAGSARAHIDQLVDVGSFVEVGRFARSQQPNAAERTPADGVITGWARVHGRPVAVVAEDGEVLAWTDAQVGENKRNRLIALAVHRQVPIVLLLDGTATRATVGNPMAGDLFGHLAGASPAPVLADHPAPIVAVAVGTVTGDNATLAASADVVVATIDDARRCLTILDVDSGPLVPSFRTGDATPPTEEPLAATVDPGSVVELASTGRIRTGLARLGGYPTLFAQTTGDELTVAELRLLHRIVSVGARLHVPFVSIQDSPGYAAGLLTGSAEAASLIRDIGEGLRRNRAAKLALITGRGQALGTFVLGGRRLGYDYIAAWPWAELPVTPDGTIAPEHAGPWLAAGMGIVDDVVTPEETRPRLATYLDILAAARALPTVEEQRGRRLVADIAKV